MGMILGAPTMGQMTRRWRGGWWYGIAIALVLAATGLVSSCAVVGAAGDVAGAAVDTATTVVSTAGHVVTAPVR